MKPANTEKVRQFKELAKDLLQHASESGDAAIQYQALKMGHDAAIRSGMPELVNELTMALVRQFPVDELQLRLTALERFSLTVSQFQQGHALIISKQVLSELAASTGEAAMRNELYTEAATAFGLARKNANQDRAQREYETLKREARSQGNAAEAKEPMSPPPGFPELANQWSQILGEHWCYDLNQWDKGLKFLEQGHDTELIELARREIKLAAATGNPAVEIGHAWFELAKESERFQRQKYRRAEYWYRKAMPDATGNLKSEAEANLAIASIRSRPASAGFPIRRTIAQGHQHEWANYLGQPVEITNSVRMSFQLIPPGRATLGSPGNQREFVLPDPIYFGTFEVRQQEFRRVMGTNPSWFSTTGGGRPLLKNFNTVQHPVEHVTWQQALDFCEKLSARPRELRAGHHYRLPTEDEWEYACRAGTDSRFGNGDDARPQTLMWFGENSERLTHPVGQRGRNQWGLFDMHGNVWEWCDRNDADEKSETAPRRGGGWISDPDKCTSSYRDSGPVDQANADCGFRVVLVIKPEE